MPPASISPQGRLIAKWVTDPSTPLQTLFPAQDCNRIESCGTARGNPAREQRDDEQQRRNSRVDDGIRRADAEEKISDCGADSDTQSDSDQQPGACQCNALAQH